MPETISEGGRAPPREGVKLAIEATRPFLLLLLCLMLAARVSQALSISFAQWVVALGALLSVGGAIRPERLELMERDIVRSLGSNVDDQPDAPTRAKFIFGVVIVFIVMQMWLETYLVLDRFIETNQLTWLGNAALIGLGFVMLGGWMITRKNRAAGVLGTMVVILGVLMANAYAVVTIVAILIARFVFYPMVERVALKTRRRLEDERHPDWISPLLFLGLSAVAAGAVYLALQQAPPVRWW